MKYNVIAVDTEYHTNNIKQIDNVYCVACTDKTGKVFKKWISSTKDPEILNEIINYYGYDKDSVVFVCHALDLAERRAFKFLDVDVKNYKWLDTYHLARMLTNTFTKKKDQTLHLSDEEAIEAAIKAKQSKEKALSYAGLCTQYKLALIDTEHKQAMRKLCIDNTTEGNEQQIMDYCADDTKFLIPLFTKLFSKYKTLLNNAFCPLAPHKFDQATDVVAFEALLQQCKTIINFGEIADRGLPINTENALKIKRNSLTYREKLKKDFNDKYPGCYELSAKDNLYHEKSKVIQKYLLEQLKKSHIVNFPRTNSGNLSTRTDLLWDRFKNTDTFAEHYSNCKWTCNQLNKCAKLDENPFDYIIDNNKLWYESLKCYRTITGRCAPSTKRFIFGWPKFLYGILEPQKGKWLVELDYSSEETEVQAAICRDSVYNDIYQSKDIYLAFANKMGLIPDDYDADDLSVDELKKKYKAVRSKIKPIVLGLSYGMQAKSLSEHAKMPLYEAEKYVNQITQIILRKSTLVKEQICEIAALPGYSNTKAFALPDGFICKYDARTANHTTVNNWAFQSGGSEILHNIINTFPNDLNGRVKLLASIHDAIFFEVDEGDTEAIERVKQHMIKVANETLGITNKPGWGIKVGEPEIVKNSEPWTPEHSFDSQFEELLNYNG